jgi:Holliday junction DNA helicase RuvA
MISRLTGMLLAKDPPTILLDVQGIGYEVDVPMTTLFELPSVGASITLYTHFAVREDAHQLFGFLQESDRRLFRDLLRVNGIGARTALGILSGMNAANIVDCILSENITLLTKIPGIGRKTAERLVIELRDRFKALTGKHNSNANFAPYPVSIPNAPKDDAINALISLGYRPHDAAKAVEKCYNDSHSSETLIKLALQSMVK